MCGARARSHISNEHFRAFYSLSDIDIGLTIQHLVHFCENMWYHFMCLNFIGCFELISAYLKQKREKKTHCDTPKEKTFEFKIERFHWQSNCVFFSCALDIKITVSIRQRNKKRKKHCVVFVHFYQITCAQRRQTVRITSQTVICRPITSLPNNI